MSVLRPIRLVTLVALGCFLFVQVAEACHYHAPPDVNHFASPKQLAAVDLCPICLHHSQTNFAVSVASPSLEPRCLVASLRLEPRHSVALEIRFSFFGRAPPAAV